jgi:hypothetical protein
MDSFSKQHQITSTEMQITTFRNRGYALMKKSAKPFVLISLFCLWLDGIPTFGIDLPFVSALQPHYLIDPLKWMRDIRRIHMCYTKDFYTETTGQHNPYVCQQLDHSVQ